MKRQLQEGVMDQIEFGLELGYFKKVDNQLYINEESKISFTEFDFRYKDYLKKDNLRK